MGVSRGLIAVFLGSVAALGWGCDPTNDGIMAGINRSAINTLTVSCNNGGQCTDLGNVLLHKTSESRQSDWQQPLDIPGAKRAFQRACMYGDGRGCACMVEFGLTDSAEDKRLYEVRAAYFHSPVRDAATVAADEAAANAEAAAANAGLRDIRAAESAKADRDRQGIASAVRQAGNQMQESLAAAKKTAPASSKPATSKASSSNPSAPAPVASGETAKHCRNPYKDSRSGNDLVCITTGPGHPCIKDDECDTVRCMIPGVAALHDPGESGNGVCCSQAGRGCDKQRPCCPEAHCNDDTGTCKPN